MGMTIRWYEVKILLFLLLLAVVVAAPVARSETNKDLSDPTILSREEGMAFLEALEFCLTQAGTPTHFDEHSREQMLRQMQALYPEQSLAVRQALATARETWAEYKSTWPRLSDDEKYAFMYDVIAIAYGVDEADALLGSPVDYRSSDYQAANVGRASARERG